MKEEMAMNRRKIDRKGFRQMGKLNEVMFQKQYKFKEHLRIDLDKEKELQ